MTTPLHPHHDETAACLRELYSKSIPEAGIVVEQFPFGLFRYSRFKALELKPTEKIRISFTDSEKVIQFMPADDPRRKTLLMPHSSVRESHPGRTSVPFRIRRRRGTDGCTRLA